MKLKPNSLTHKEFVAKVAEYSSYYKHEVDDILHFVGVVLAELCMDNKEVHIRGVGHFTAMRKDPYTFMSKLHGREVTVASPKAGLNVKADAQMKRLLNPSDTEE